MRKWSFFGASIGQALAAPGTGLTAVTLLGTAAGLVVLTQVIPFSLARDSPRSPVAWAPLSNEFPRRPQSSGCRWRPWRQPGLPPGCRRSSTLRQRPSSAKALLLIE